MTEQDLELLSQFIDGELAPERARTLRERLLAEPDLRAGLDRMKAVDARLRQAFSEEGTVPPRVAALLEDCEVAASEQPSGHGRRWGFAIAASVLAAAVLLVSPDWRQEQPTGDVLLAQALEKVPSGGDAWAPLGDERQLMPLLTFQTHEGSWCREFLLQESGESWHGVACREGESRWTTERLVAEKSGSAQGDYRPAGASDPGTVAAFVDQHAVGIPLSAAEEADLIANDWH